jgi:hypothetical protein
MDGQLTLRMSQLFGEVGHYNGWGRGADEGEEAWSASKLLTLRRVVDEGLRRFYFQAMVDPRDGAHNWTFLAPSTTVTLPSGERLVDLPDDFGGFTAVVTVSDGSGGGYWPIDVTQDRLIEQKYAMYPTVTGRPLLCGLRAVEGTDRTRGSRYRLYVYPEPDQDYTLTVPYFILPNRLTSAAPFPYGGPMHAGTIMSAMRATAEEMLDNVQNGPEFNAYMRKLAASISADRRNAPRTLGRNTDRSDPSLRHFDFPTGLWGNLGHVTFDGVRPE